MRYFFVFAGFLVSSLFGASLQAQDAGAPPETARKTKTHDAARRRESRREQVEARLRAMMSEFGVDDAKQNALVAYLAEEEAGRVGVRDATKRLVIAVRKGAEAERMRELISAYKAALEADKERRAAAQTALDAKIGFSHDPRLEAVLWLFGVLGEGQPRPPFMGPRVATDAGVVVGTVENKGEGWIEVRESGGQSERYLALGGQIDAPKGSVPNNGMMGAIRAAKIGDRVRLQWVGSERKRIVKLETRSNFTLEKNGAPQNTLAKSQKTGKDRTPQLPKAER